jgi:hypothetical protein
MALDYSDPSIAAFYGIPEEAPKGPTDAQIASQGTSNPYYEAGISPELIAQLGTI